MGNKQSVPTTFFCPETGMTVSNPLGMCEQCSAAHDIIWQLVYVCPNTGYRIEGSNDQRLDKGCPSCFQMHKPYSKRVYICPNTGSQIPHPRETGGRCQKCKRTHEDGSGSMVSVGTRSST
ncbi:hypothetical protein QBC46DRAFT_361915 [Diplogelasinospora grovesii]|uniref:Uncharacterized protein n=1 Tax=Diplogelasinospora grovesii TaxID=303347 RepID=A0AAN6S7J5_9PEZI|nr:hypothetical protein QBC46DRAFT_361915 [Diplogelasinospora grovesii]